MSHSDIQNNDYFSENKSINESKEETSSDYQTSVDSYRHKFKDDNHEVHLQNDILLDKYLKLDYCNESQSFFKRNSSSDNIDDLIQSHITSLHETITCENECERNTKLSCYETNTCDDSSGKPSTSLFSNADTSQRILDECASKQLSVTSFCERLDHCVKNTTDNSENNIFSNKSTDVLAENMQSKGVHSNGQHVKTKLRSIWNNIKYGWRMKREVSLKLDSATWLLGHHYHNKPADSSSCQDAGKDLKLDFLSKIWLSYRINFPPILGTDLISDTGWGCMLRCGQMMMAQAFVCHFLNRDWRLSMNQSAYNNSTYKMILRFFGDSMSLKSPFSLHRMVSFGEKYGRKPGDWYGPTHAAQVLRDALDQSKEHHMLLRNLCMYVALDGIVFKQDIVDLCIQKETAPTRTLYDDNPKVVPEDCLCSSDLPTKDIYDFQTRPENLFLSKLDEKPSCDNFLQCSEESKIIVDKCPSYSEFGPPSFNSSMNHYWKSLILFVSVRLGNDKINPFYIPCLKSLLAYEHCIGIIGGRPKHALYFIGWQDDKLIHLDPHSCQPAIDADKDNFNEKSFHSSSMRTMSFSEMDPSCAIGFYFKQRKEYENFIEKFSEITAPMKRNLDYPIFALTEGKRIDIENIDLPTPYSKTIVSSDNSCCNDEDYILL